MEKVSEITLSCRQCGKQFIFTESEQEFYKQKGFTPPAHCRDCRLAKKSLNPVLCSKCGGKMANGSVGYCASCAGSIQLEFELEAKKLKEALSEAAARLGAAEAERAQLADTFNAKITAMESEKSQITSDAGTKLGALESDMTKQINEAEKKLAAVESDNACLSALLEQERQLTAKLQEQLST